PKRKTFIVLPRWIVAPVLVAVPPLLTSVTPRSSAFIAGEVTGAETLISTALKAWPAATVTAPVAGAGTGVGVDVFCVDELLPPPQPRTNKMNPEQTATPTPVPAPATGAVTVAAGQALSA